MTQRDIAGAVKQMRAHYGENDPFQLCDAMGILLLRQPMGIHNSAIKGFFMCCKRIPVITVNSDLPWIIQRIIVAHELGHAVLHRDEAIHAFHESVLYDQTTGMEREANMFAAELLLEDEAVLDALQVSTSFFDAAARLMVPQEILVFKLRIMKQKGYGLAEIPVQADSNFIRAMNIPGNHDGY